jgi:hypothetical protein
MVTWSELERRVYLDVGELTWHEIETYTAAVWPLLRRLTADERERLRRGLLDGTLRNIEETRGRHSAPDPVEGAALRLMGRFVPKDAAQLAAYLAVLIALLSWLRGHPDPAPQPPPVTVIIHEMPPEIRADKPEPSPPNGLATGRS